MATNDALKQSLEHFLQQLLQQRQRKLDEIRSIETTIRQIQGQVGEAGDLLELSTASAISATPESVVANSAPGTYTPRADEFFGMAQGEAAKAFLEKVGRAVSLDELVQALKAGGCKVGGIDPKKTLYISLVRNVRDFVPVQSGVIGLRKFYPNTARAGRPSKADAQKAKHAKKLKAKARAAAAKAAKAAKQATTRTSPGAVKEVVRKIMSDHVPRTPEQVHKTVNSEMSQEVKKVAVVGALRSKDYELKDDKYQLRHVSEGPQVVQ
jgi:hypothetical protein